MIFQKYESEERYRYFQFKRDDGEDGLAEGETLSTANVTCAEKISGADRSSSMISEISIIENTKVKYKLKAGKSKTFYIVSITAVTNLGQRLEGRVEIEIL